MKTKFNKILLGIVCSLVIVNVNGEQKSVTTTATFVTQAVTDFMRKNNVPGMAVEIYTDGQPHAYYFGFANLEKKTPITGQTIFEVGSFTKVFTSLLAAEQVQQGKMKLDDAITKYLPNLPASNNNLNKITLSDLATHTSSLPFNVGESVVSQSGLQQFFRDWQPSVTIGSQWEYSNIGIGLLGYALEANTGQNYNQLLREKILIPLAMDPIGISVAQGLQENYARGYSKDGKAVPPLEMYLFPAAGAMRASGQDMLRFLSAAIGLSETPSAIQQAMKLTQTAFISTADMQQGLAWEIHPLNAQTLPVLLTPSTEMNLGPLPAKHISVNQRLFDGSALIDKTGATDGFRSYIAVIPNHKTGIVILMNHYVSNGEIVKLGRTILFKLNNLT